ncbi:MAG: helix-turn-helix transcriptional regulator [Bacteroidota bacterium]|nr:helix-turn-helix transcriptional regulator [Bacteroidota bacterium]
MKESSIAKVLNEWETEEKLLLPINKQLSLEVIDQIALLFAGGSFYYYILNFDNSQMDFVHEGIQEVLGIKPSEFSIPKLIEVMYPEDLDMINLKEQAAQNFLFKTIPQDEISLYKVAYLIRLQHSKGKYKTILHQEKAINVSDAGKILQVIVVHTDISYLNPPFDHKISFISSKRPSYFSIIPDTSLELIKNSLKNILSVREKEIIKKVAEGKSLNEIADLLFLSPHTVNTHKKNILRKSHCKNTSELIARCIREGII